MSQLSLYLTEWRKNKGLKTMHFHVEFYAILGASYLNELFKYVYFLEDVYL